MFERGARLERMPVRAVLLPLGIGKPDPGSSELTVDLLHERRTLEANIHPLREVAREARGILLFGIKYSEKIVVLSVARLLGQAIKSIHEETSVSSLFV